MTIPREYYAGRNSRDNGEHKHAPAWMSIEARHWWLAGWNDRDMELLHK